MADAIAFYAGNITFTEALGYFVVYGARSLCKGTLNMLHLRHRHQCEDCQEEQHERQLRHLSRAMRNEYEHHRREYEITNHIYTV